MLKQLSDWLAASPASLAIQEQLWVVPAVQSLHILAIGFLIFSAISANTAVIRGRGHMAAIPWLPSAYRWTWAALFLLFVTGAVLVVGEPERELLNLLFRIKMVLVVAAAGLTLLLQRLSRANSTEASRAGAFALAGLSVATWLAIIFCGRLIAYFGKLAA